ncbi:DEAD/DEAH box helicase [Heterostelium album PN500]|uniref:RNA helicase n=1 Tax=Heterostelium pallidum (strain ATCC 26659 / Pp 5 / PN500) TaxID=670386 RepID=D3B6F6_HETP5|nr:DEAD/DEAH box helicase [Heterostelium album PN500]EFA82926.1 DEAD/DEAH box helicase [Heterostelium album PN500]|eukprot:XP_020435043.1 DEAD/DEAH box helicase [Heterostelium album PN500]
MSTELKRWVADQMTDILGFRENTLVDYILALAKKSNNNVDKLVSELESNDFPSNANTREFAGSLLQRMPSSSTTTTKTSNSKSQKEQEKDREKQTLDILKMNESYQIIRDIQDNESSSSSEDEKRKKKEKREKREKEREREREREKEKDRKKDKDNDREKEREREREKDRDKERYNDKDRNIRKKSNDNGWEDDDTVVVSSRERSGSSREKRDSDDREKELESEDEYEREQREIKEYNERLKQRDLDKTKKKGGDYQGSKHGQDESERRKQMKDKNDQFERDRVTSRRKFLVGEEQKRLVLLKRELDDEYELFKNEKLTAKEIKEYEKKKKLYELASQKINDIIEDDHYRLPGQANKDDMLKPKFDTGRSTRGNREENLSFNPEQREWERTQMAAAQEQNIQGRNNNEEQYDFVFDDQISFIKEQVITGKKDDAVETLQVGDEPQVKAKSIAEVRKSLPIYPYREQLLEAVAEYQVIIIVGETGSGKTTQIPQYLHEAGYTKRGKVGCTQPRRVAAMSVAARVAEEMNCKLGNEVGYSIRFEDCTSDKTVLQYMTDGMLVREFLTTPDLSNYSVLIIDEAHERTLHTDILFGLVKDVARFRPDLKLLISSATLDADKFSAYFDDAPIFNIPGRRYEVSTHYTQAPEADYLDAAVVTVLQIHITEPLGDILVFLTGQEEVDTAAELLLQRTRGLGSKIKELIITRIYATLPTDLQAKIFEPTPPNARKVVLATNIAETSLTIDGIVYVIDPGFCKQKNYNPRTGMESLSIMPVSKASANQRKGRAGRVAPGKCFRLFTAWAYENELEDNTVPEIQRTNLGNVVLLLKSMGINDLIHFDFMDPPPAETLIKALEQLYALGALNDRGQLTKLGRRMAEFPLDPQLSKMIIASEKYKVTEEIMTICAMLSVNNTIFYRPKDKAIQADAARKTFSHPQGDHLTLLNVFNHWRESGYSTQWCFENFIQHRTMKRAQDVREQLEGLMERVEIQVESNPDDTDAIRKSIASGFFYHTAKLENSGTYRTTKHNQSVQIHPSSCLFQSAPKWVIYHELVETTKEFMRQVIEIQPQWLVEIAPHFYKEKDIDSENKKLPKARGKAQIN